MRGLWDCKDQSHLTSADKSAPAAAAIGLIALMRLSQRGDIIGMGRYRDVTIVHGDMAMVHDDAHEIDGVSRAQLVHDPAAMNLDRA